MPVYDRAARGKIGGLTKAANAAVRRLVEARAQQGLPLKCADPVLLAVIAAAIRPEAQK